MTAPSYTNDLTDLSTAESATGWVEMTGSVTLSGGSEAFNTQGAPAGGDPDYPFIQGLYSVTQDCTKDVGVGSLAYNNGSGTGGHGTDGAYLVWQNYMINGNIETYANDGFMLVVGSSTSDFDVWTVGGADKAPYPYGGWVNHAVNTTVTPDYTAGTPTATEQYIGAAVYVTVGSSKGETHNVDAIRYGRCSAIFEFGDGTSGYCTFSGFATENDYNDATNGYNRWGLISATSGGYLWKGRMELGNSTNLVDFRDSNKTIFIQWTPKVTANFNLIEIQNTSSNVEWTNITIQCLDTTTASQGRFLMTDAATVDINSCNFIDMDTFVFNKSTNPVTIDDTTWRRCGQITSGGATFTGCLFSNGTDTTAVLASSPANAALITNSTFVSDGTGHGLEITGTAANMTLTNVDFSGYAATDGSTGNEAIYVNIASGSMNLTISGGTTPSIRTAGATVNLVVGARTVKGVAVDSGGSALTGTRAFLRTAASATGGLPYDATVTITRSGTTATVSHTAHNMATNDQVLLTGITDKTEDNGVHTITKIDADSYSYTTTDSGSTSYTGTIKCYFVFFKGLANTGTDSNEISMSRTIPADQQVTGWMRRSSGSPYYKEGLLAGSVSTSGDVTLTGVLISDD